MNGFLAEGWLTAFVDACNADRELQAIGRRSRFSPLLRSGERQCLLRFEDGLREARLETGIDDAWDFTIAAPPDAWERFLQPVPPRFHQDLFAMWMCVPGFRIDGDRRRFMASARVVRRLGELARLTVSGPQRRSRPIESRRTAWSRFRAATSGSPLRAAATGCTSKRPARGRRSSSSTPPPRIPGSTCTC